MTTVIALLYEAERLESRDLRWPLRMAALQGGEIVVLAAPAAENAQRRRIDLRPGKAGDEAADQALADSLRALLDRELTPEGWIEWSQKPSDRVAGAPSPVRVALRRMPVPELEGAIDDLIDAPRRDLLVTVLEKMPREVDLWRELARRLWRDASCRFACVVPGRREDDGGILFEPSRGPYPSVATPLAVGLAQRYGRESMAQWSEPPITSESARVGRRLLDQALDRAVGVEASEVERNVDVEETEETNGLLRALEDDRFELCIVGTQRPTGEDFGIGQALTRLTRVAPDPTWIFTRAAIRAHTRIERFFESRLRRIVPQLAREERADFVARVQSSSEWNFDFIALMGLATAIATFGLIGDSGAVIIGAMLVAPLMTPLMGIGMSIVQSNLRLAALTARTSFLGFLLAFLIGVTLGTLDTEFGVATGEMYARHWPTMVDLAVAFVAGLAAAYASGRPSLLAALPGVAIAASLVPPIASSGLAVSLGDYDLALGAMLLFFVNVVAIVFATALVLWLVGMHGSRQVGRAGRLLAAALSIVIILTALALVLSPPRSAAPLALVERVEEVLGDEYRIRDITLRHDGGPVLQIDIGGSVDHHPDRLGENLTEIAREYLGENAAVRVTYRHEILLR